MKHFSYTPSGTCSRRIDFDIEDGKVRNVTFSGGCPGNTVGLAAIVEGCEAADVVRRLRGIPCRDKSTSCPDQLAKAVAEAIAE